MNKLHITKPELQRLVRHVLSDISYGGGGTFCKPDTTKEDFDEAEAEKVLATLAKLLDLHTKQ